MKILKNREKISVHVNVLMYKIMCTAIKVGIDICAMSENQGSTTGTVAKPWISDNNVLVEVTLKMCF